MKRTFFLAAVLSVLAATPALADAGHTMGADLVAGLIHPFMGLDHILAMFAVGMLAVQSGGKAKIILPTLFVSGMAIGGYVGLSALSIPFMEQVIIASVILLGIVIALGGKLPLGASALMVITFALFHGAAHGIEMPIDTSIIAYGLGILSATALLHAFGIGAALVAPYILRYAGAIVAVAGMGLAVTS